MSEDRTAMNAALRATLGTALRGAGFRGSLPHFRRPEASKTDLLTVQFSSWGGQFVLEIAQVPGGGFITPWGKQIAANRLTTYDAPLTERCRLGPQPASAGDSWFRFEGDDSERFRRAAEAVVGVLPQALAYWAGQRQQPNVRPFAAAAAGSGAPVT